MNQRQKCKTSKGSALSEACALVTPAMEESEENLNQAWSNQLVFSAGLLSFAAAPLMANFFSGTALEVLEWGGVVKMTVTRIDSWQLARAQCVDMTGEAQGASTRGE